MNIIRNYKFFLKESVDSDREIKTINDVPEEVMQTSRRIVSDIFDKVRKISFDYDSEYGLIMKFIVSSQDFNYIDEEEILKLDVGEGARKKRTFDVTLKFFDAISETLEVQYIVQFEMNTDEEVEDYDEDDEDVIVDDDWEKPDEDDDDFDEDVADQDIKKGKIKLDGDEIDIEYDNEDEEEI